MSRKTTNLELVKRYAKKYAKQRKKLLEKNNFFWQYYSSMQTSRRMIYINGLAYRNDVLFEETKKNLIDLDWRIKALGGIYK